MKRYFLLSTIITLTLFSCSKEEGQGGRASISGTIEGTEISTARAEITEIICPPGSAINIADNTKNYWLINTPGINDYVIYYTGLTDNRPEGGNLNRTEIRVILNGNPGGAAVAQATEFELNLLNVDYDFDITRDGELLTMKCTDKGAVPDADNGGSTFLVDTETQGRDQVTEFSGKFPDEDVYIIYGDKDDFYDDNVKTSYDGNFKFTNLRKGNYRIFAYSKDKSNISQPLTPVMESIEIGGKDDANIGKITIEKK